MHTKQQKITHNMYNSYMFQRQSSIFREFKAQSFAITNTILVSH
jgi:hypothetical protein